MSRFGTLQKYLSKTWKKTPLTELPNKHLINQSVPGMKLFPKTAGPNQMRTIKSEES